MCRFAEINLAYVRDSLADGLLSFIDAIANIAGVGAEIQGNGKTPHHFRATGVFGISFLGGGGCSETLPSIQAKALDSTERTMGA